MLLELFGYIGTALVLLSMMMTSVMKLRVFNTIGSIIGMIYSFLCGAWPVVFLNFGLIIINIFQIVRLRNTKVTFTRINVNPADKTLDYFLTACTADIIQYFPGYKYHHDVSAKIYMVFDGVEPVGILVGEHKDNCFQAELDYVTKKYRDCSIANFLFAELKADGYAKLAEKTTSEVHGQYLQKMGFEQQGEMFVKQL